MSFLIDIFLFVLFAISSGLFANERFRKNYLAVGIAGAIASTATIFLFIDLSSKVAGTHPSAPASLDSRPFKLYSGETRDGPFSKVVLTTLVDRSFANVCRLECNHICIRDDCKDGSFRMLRLPVNSNVSYLPKEPRAYLAVTEDQDFCGSGGCSSIVLIINQDGTFGIVAEDLGISERLALLMAQQALANSK